MKNYIFILSLAAAMLLQACDRSEALSSTDETINLKITQARSAASAVPDDPAMASPSDQNSLETGDDDEPRKDKSHWRIPTDSIRP